MLPKALLPVELVEADGVLMLRVLPAVMIGDPAQRYFLSHTHNAFASDDVTVSIDPLTGMLTGVTATAEDKSLAVLSEVLKAGVVRRRAEGGGAPQGETVLFRGLFDPDGQVGRETPNGRLVEGLQRALLQRVDADTDACVNKPEHPNCRLAKRLKQSLAPEAELKDAVVEVKVAPLAAVASGVDKGETQSTAKGPSVPTVDCGTGVCYRSLQPFAVELAIKNVYAQSAVVLLPNGGAPVALPLDRAPFVKTEYTIQFSGGQLQSVQTKRPSSALALAKWPLEIYQSVLEATATLIQLRIGANAKEVELATSQLDTAKELKRIGEEMAKLKYEGGTVPDGGVVLGGPRRGDALIAIELGHRPVRLSNIFPQTPGVDSAPDTLPGQPK